MRKRPAVLLHSKPQRRFQARTMRAAILVALVLVAVAAASAHGYYGTEEGMLLRCRQVPAKMHCSTDVLAVFEV